MIDKNLGDHYTWGQGCDGWHLVRTAEMSVIQERMPPHTSEARHYHWKARQFFFVLAGEATLEGAGELQSIRAGQGIEIPPQAAHTMMNRGEQDLEFLVISCPPSHGDRVNLEK